MVTFAEFHFHTWSRIRNIKILGLNFSFSCYIALYPVTPISRLFFLLFSCGVTHEQTRLRWIQLCSDQLPERVWCALSGFPTLKSKKRKNYVLVAGSLLCNFLTRHYIVSQTKTFSRSFKYKGATNISPCKPKIKKTIMSLAYSFILVTSWFI